MSTNRRRPSATLTKIMSSITEEDQRHTRDRMLIAVKIADALKAKDLSQKAFAKLMGKSESEISEWLSGNRNFTIDTLSDISNCLNIPLLPDSDMRTKNIPTVATHRKIAKTRSPRRYSMSWNSIISPAKSEWGVLNNRAFSIA